MARKQTQCNFCAKRGGTCSLHPCGDPAVTQQRKADNRLLNAAFALHNNAVSMRHTPDEIQPECPLCGGALVQHGSVYRRLICKYNPGRLVWTRKDGGTYIWRQCTFGVQKQ